MSESEYILLAARNKYALAPDNLGIEGKVPPDRSGAERYQTLSGLLKVLRYRWKLVAMTAALVFGVGVGVYFLIASYVATTIIEVNKDDPTDNDGAQTNGPVFNSDDIKEEVQTDVDILQTDNRLALGVIEQLNLLGEHSFRQAIDADEKGLRIDRAPRTRDNALNIFHRHLKVDTPPDSRLITISYKSPNAILSAAITNALARTFIEDTLSRRKRSILTSSTWLQHELDDLKAKMQESQQNLADYERNSGLAGVQLTGPANGNTTVSVAPENTVTSRLLMLNQELTAAEANRISTEAVNRLVKSNDPEVVLGLGPMAVSSANGGAPSSITPESIGLLTQLRAQETDLKRQLSAATVKYGENNPRRIEIQSQLDSLQQQIQAELGRVRARAAHAYDYARLNEDSVRRQFQRQQDAANDLADKSVKLQLLAQEAFSNQTLYENLFSKLQTATLASGTRASRIDIVADAIPGGSPNFPKLEIYLAAVAAAGLFFGVTIAFVRESMDETVRTLHDLTEIRGHVFPGYIPRTHALGAEAGERIESELITSPNAPFSEAFRSLRTMINLSLSRAYPRTILVTSGLGNAGKTTVVYNLGVAYAQQGARVLLLDADLRNPDLHRFFSASVTPGVTEACAKPENAELTGVIPHPVLPSLFLLPAGERPHLPSELVASPAFETLLRKLSGSFDYVFVDSPPMLAVTDASVIATMVNGVIAVVRSRSTTRLAVSAIAECLQSTNTPVLGFVLNGVDNPALDGFYQYSYSRRKGDQLAISA